MSEKLASIKKVGGGGTPSVSLVGAFQSSNNTNRTVLIEPNTWYQINASFNNNDTSFRQSCVVVDPNQNLTLLYGTNYSAGGSSWSYVFISNGYIYMRGTGSGTTNFIVTKTTIQ